MAESPQHHQGGSLFKEVEYDDASAQGLAFELVANALTHGTVSEAQALRVFGKRVVELRDIMRPNLIYTDQRIAEEREYHLRQPWTD